jgi:hypothetical protein
MSDVETVGRRIRELDQVVELAISNYVLDVDLRQAIGRPASLPPGFDLRRVVALIL